MRVSGDFISGLLKPRPKQPTARERSAANRQCVLQAVAKHRQRSTTPPRQDTPSLHR